MEEKQSRAPLFYLFVALTASVCLAVTIAYLEIRRDAEVEQLRGEVAMLLQYVEILKVKINRTESFTKTIEEMLKAMPKSSPTATGNNYDEDDDYYDDYEYEYDDKNVKQVNSTSREKRSIDDNGGRIHNILHMRRHPMFQNSQDNPQVMAKIVITGNDEDSSSQTPRPTYLFHTGVKPEVIHHPGDKPKNKYGDDDECINCEQRPVLGHFGGDTTAITRERHYDNNHRMYHPGGLFKEWTPATWMRDVDMDGQVQIERGILRVTDSPGIYFFYAQIFYADEHDSAGYRIYVNDHPVLQCTTTTISSHNSAHHIKRNSCYTGGLIKLRTDDRITLKEVEGRRYTVFEKTKSFFGLFRVAKTNDD